MVKDIFSAALKLVLKLLDAAIGIVSIGLDSGIGFFLVFEFWRLRVVLRFLGFGISPGNGIFRNWV